MAKIADVIKSLGMLEDDLDSLDDRVADAKKKLAVKAQAEIDSLLQKTKEMATQEAQSMIDASRKKAEAESKAITRETDERLAQIKERIDENFDEAVEYVVATVLKE